MALKTTPNWIDLKQKSVEEVFTFVPYEGQSAGFGTPIVKRRIRTITDKISIAMTETGAKAVTDSAANTTIVASEENRYCNSWQVTKHTDSRSEWVTDT